MLSDEDFIQSEIYILKEFKFQNGEILKDVPVEYMVMGTPQYDNDGKITNGIVYCHGSSGNFGSLKRIKEVLGEGQVFDTDKFFIISLSALGSPNSISPSVSNLKGKFPRYTIEDMVNFQIAFLKDKFNIDHLKGLVGNSMGGFEVLTWGVKYPNFMDFIVSLVSSFKVAGHNYAISKQMNDIILSDPDYNGGDFIMSESFKRTMSLAIQTDYCYGFSRQYYREMSNDEIDKSILSMVEDLDVDPNDIVFRNYACNDYDIEDQLKNIEAKVFILAINQDQYFPPELDGVVMSEMIEGSTLVRYDSILGHIGSNQLKQVENKLEDFLKEFKR